MHFHSSNHNPRRIDFSVKESHKKKQSNKNMKHMLKLPVTPTIQIRQADSSTVAPKLKRCNVTLKQ
jgi:hypothetical protein